MTKLKNYLWRRNKPINLLTARQILKEKLALAGCQAPGQISLVLLQHALKQSKSWLLSHTNYKLTSLEYETLQEITQRYLQGIPLPYILGHWEFYGRNFIITPDVLIPRPETEILVELALEYARSFKKPRIADVGTGSGCIAISLASELKDVWVLGIDLSLAALKIARLNALALNQTQVSFLQSDLLTPISAKFDLICANLPYIPSQTLTALTVSRWEPQLALDGGQSGLEVIHRLLVHSHTSLASNGVILLEIEARQGASALAIAQNAFPDAECTLVPDLAGHDRIVKIRLIPKYSP